MPCQGAESAMANSEVGDVWVPWLADVITCTSVEGESMSKSWESFFN